MFAAAVPKNANSNLRDLCEEVLEDHKAMVGTDVLGCVVDLRYPPPPV